MGDGGVSFGVGESDLPTAQEAARAAVGQALASLGGAAPKLAIVFTSITYDDVDGLPLLVRGLLPGVPRVGGSAGGALYGPGGVVSRGVSCVLLGGDDIEVSVETVPVVTWDVVEVVPAAAKLAARADEAAKRGLGEFLCLVFAPGLVVDGDALTAAIRKGAGARAQLAGGLTGDDLRFERTSVIASGEYLEVGVVMAGIFTRRAVGVAARHGGAPIGRPRTVTRSDGSFLHTLDDRTALEVWTEDARATGAVLPDDPKALAICLANNYPLGLADRSFGAGAEVAVRIPYEVLPDGSLRMSAGLPEGSTVRVMRLTREAMLGAAAEAAKLSLEAVGGEASGALVLGCSGRLAILGDAFGDEIAHLASHIRAPIGGACVFGEIARSRRDVGAFFNTTQVVVAFPK
jgi:hypothetical protein